MDSILQIHGQNNPKIQNNLIYTLPLNKKVIN